MTFVQTLIDSIALGSLYALVAMGIGLVFGVMRLVNFAYGELITAGAFALALTNEQPLAARIAIVFVIVIAMSVGMEFIFRPLRQVTPATMLMATFALSFLLQNLFLVIFGSQGKRIEFLTPLRQAIEIGDLRIRWVTIVAIVIGVLLLAAMGWLLGRTSIGLQMRAAAADFRTARILGVRANRVIVIAFVLAGFLAAAVTLVLSIQRPLATPTFGFFVLVPALVGVVVGGMGRLVSATLGGFLVGVATVLLGDLLPSSQRVFLNTVLTRKARVAERV